MTNNYTPTRDTVAFSKAVNQLRQFFLGREFRETHTQDRLSILAACEDPTTIAKFKYLGNSWPLPQTGQMWLEYELLKNSGLAGVFCTSTSYRNEPNPIPGRHELIFPMFEFESHGSIDELRKTMSDLCEYLGFGSKKDFIYVKYDDATKFYQTKELTAEHESRMEKDFGSVVFLEKFPLHTSPFWNMRRDGNYARKIDVIICGMETIGSAERSVSKEEMRDEFRTISDGQYAERLYNEFEKERVNRELEEFLSFEFFPRFGGGVGMTRLIRAMKKMGLV
jgi:aspartyl/asparaginyl-tRNA synthetase